MQRGVTRGVEEMEVVSRANKNHMGNDIRAPRLVREGRNKEGSKSIWLSDFLRIRVVTQDLYGGEAERPG